MYRWTQICVTVPRLKKITKVYGIEQKFVQWRAPFCIFKHKPFQRNKLGNNLYNCTQFLKLENLFSWLVTNLWNCSRIWTNWPQTLILRHKFAHIPLQFLAKTSAQTYRTRRKKNPLRCRFQPRNKYPKRRERALSPCSAWWRSVHRKESALMWEQAWTTCIKLTQRKARTKKWEPDDVRSRNLFDEYVYVSQAARWRWWK